jgi:K+-transporting ATPase ATPase A chain
MLEITLIVVASLLLAWSLGIYMAGIFSAQPHASDRIFLPIEKTLYRLLGINAARGMNWKTYGSAFLLSNFLLFIAAFLLFLFQHRLPLNPDGIGPLSWDLALHTAVSFITNTNQQHYSGQAQLSYFSQSVAIVTLQFVTPAMGLAICLAVLRGLLGGKKLGGNNKDTAAEGEERDLGNYYVDVTRAVVRVLIPAAAILALLLTWQGVPSSYEGAATVTTLESSIEQTIPRGPVAAMVAIKQLGTNGGGWFGPNSTNPLENPTPLSNALETIALVLIPMAVVFMAGYLLRSRRFTLMSLAAMGMLSIACISAGVYSERQPNAAFSELSAIDVNMEGKEVRFGVDASALWATLTTQTSNGSVNAMHDSLNPIAGLVTRAGMLINAIWGGIGCGLVNFMVYVWITVFLAGLMIGRTPEIFGRKLETPEIRLLGVLIVLPSLCILGLTAITLAIPSITGTSNPGFHGISQVIYEYVSAFANNGSGFEGLGDNTPWWNLSTSLCLALGRYLPLFIPLMIAGYLARKRVAPESSASLNIGSTTFCLTLVTVILLLNFLSFLPSMVLGPIGEALQLAQHSGAAK